MKKKDVTPLIGLLIIVSFAVGGYIIFKNKNGDKIDCAAHLNSSHILVSETHSSMSGVLFDDYFYSKRLKTCVAGIIKKKDILNENKAQTSYLILDTINNKEVWFALGTQYYQPQSSHEIEMTQNDVKYQTKYYSELSNLQ